MSPNQRSTADLLQRYLTGALTAPEEAELERRARTDEPLAEAMRGLSAYPAADHEARVASMLKRARTQVRGGAEEASVKPLRRAYARYAAAATVLLLLLAGTMWLVPTLLESERGEIAMSTPQEAPEATAPAETAPLPENPPADTEAPAPLPKATVSSPAPVSAPPHPRPRPEKEISVAPDPAAKAKAEATAKAKELREQSARRRAPLSAGEGELTASAEDEAISEEISAEGAPPPPPPLAPAPAAAPAPLASAPDLLREKNRPTDDAANTGAFLEGRITNENGMPVFSALVRLPGLPLGERTDSNGYFRIPADAVATRLEVSHPDYESETVALRNRPENLQVSLDRKEWQAERPRMMDGAARSVITLNETPGYAAPLEGYAALRKRLEANRPPGVPKGKVKFSFTVNTDGTLTDFEFRGRPDRATMDYIGETIVKTSVWEIMQGDEPVRVYFKVVF